MKVLIDTNVILDVLLLREPHYEASSAFLKLCGAEITGVLCISQTTDIAYFLRKFGHNSDTVRGILRKLAQQIKTLDVVAVDMSNALSSEMTDYEDALLACRAARGKVDYIVTRNEKDFALSPIPAISPQDFLAKHFHTSP